MMSNVTGAELPAPLFELRGKAARIDLSAWISGAVMAIGVAAIGPTTISKDALSGGWGLHLVIAAYLTFLVSVLIIQKHMRIALSANTFGTAQSLVTNGIFQLSRNPIYVAFILPLACLSYFSVAVAVMSIALYICVMNMTVIRKEERDLQQHFGAAFSAYRNAVPRWFV
jgi:protein-S-isoprenylcysteine O-methyltransferase Ste14